MTEPSLLEPTRKRATRSLRGIGRKKVIKVADHSGCLICTMAQAIPRKISAVSYERSIMHNTASRIASSRRTVHAMPTPCLRALRPSPRSASRSNSRDFQVSTTPPSRDSPPELRRNCRAASNKGRIFVGERQDRNLCRSTFCQRASISNRSRGLQTPPHPRSVAQRLYPIGASVVSNSSPLMRRSSLQYHSIVTHRLRKYLRAACVSNPRRPYRLSTASAGEQLARPAQASAATATISAEFHCSRETTSHPASERLDSLGRSAGPCIHRNVVAHRTTSESSQAAITCLTIVTEVVAGATGSIALNTTCAVIPSGKPAKGRNAAKSTASRVAKSVSTTGSLW